MLRAMLRWILVSVLVLAPPAAGQAEPLKLWIMPNGANPQGIIEETLAGFKAETGIDVRVTVLDWGEAWSRISVALEAGKGPDVLQLGTTWVSRFASQGKLAKLDAFASAITPERFVEAAWAATQLDGDPTIYAVPWLVDVRVLIGNRKWLSEQGVAAGDVATVDGFTRTLAKLRKARLMRDGNVPVFPFAIAGKSDWNILHNFAPWIWSQGGDFIGKVGGRWRSRLLDRNTVLGIRRYLGFALDGLVNPQCLREDNSQVDARFSNGEQVFTVPPSEVILRTRLPESQGGTRSSRIGQEGIVSFPIPAGPAGSVAFVGGTALAIPRGSEKNSKAVKLLLFLTRADNLAKYAWPIGLPADREVMEARSNDPLYRVLAEQVKHGRSYPNLPVWENVEALLVEMFSTVWTLVDTLGPESDEEIYKLLVDYSARVDKLLGVEDSRPPMTWDAFRATAQATSPLPLAAPGKQAMGADGSAAGWKAIVGTVLVGVLILVIPSVFRRVRRR
jgi:multiple sugar transport system substrate-binding protein